MNACHDDVESSLTDLLTFDIDRFFLLDREAGKKVGEEDR